MASPQDQRQAAGWRWETVDEAVPLTITLSSSIWGALVFIFCCLLSGADLLVEQLGPGAGDQKKENPNVFLVGSTWQRLLSGAEDVGLFKEYNDGSMRGFTCANKHNFTDFTGEVEMIFGYCGVLFATCQLILNKH